MGFLEKKYRFLELEKLNQDLAKVLGLEGGKDSYSDIFKKYSEVAPRILEDLLSNQQRYKIIATLEQQKNTLLLRIVLDVAERLKSFQIKINSFELKILQFIEDVNLLLGN